MVRGWCSLFCCQLLETFFAIKNIGEISKIHTITLCAQTSIAIPQKSTLKSIFSYSFWGRPSKLGSYVLGAKKNLCEPIFDLCLRSENIKFSKCPPCQKSSICVWCVYGAQDPLERCILQRSWLRRCLCGYWSS